MTRSTAIAVIPVLLAGFGMMTALPHSAFAAEDATYTCDSAKTDEQFDAVVTAADIQFPAYDMTLPLFHETAGGDRFFALQMGNDGVYMMVLPGGEPPLTLTSIAITAKGMEDEDKASCVPK